MTVKSVSINISPTPKKRELYVNIYEDYSGDIVAPGHSWSSLERATAVVEMTVGYKYLTTLHVILEY